MHINRIFEIEWTAQHLLQEYKLQGPLIQLLSEEILTKNTDILVIQGSFDPPLISHEELISKALKKYRKLFSKRKVVFLFLFSLSHVEKEVDLHTNSLLGYRVAMVKELLHSLSYEKFPFMVGISNVGRYYELTEAILRKFPEHDSIYYIMGTDVFSKIFNPKYYEKQLTKVLSDIFKANYIVAGRGETVSVQEFEVFLTSLKISSKFMSQISFVSLSKKMRYESSTKIRLQLSKDNTSKIPSIPDSIMSFLRKYHLYSKDSEIIIQEVIVQITTKIAIKEGLDQKECLKIILALLKEVKCNKEFRNQVVDEFQEKNYQILKDRIQSWLK